MLTGLITACIHYDNHYSQRIPVQSIAVWAGSVLPGMFQVWPVK